MRPLYGLLLIFTTVALLLLVSACSADSGIRVFAPTASSITADSLPLSYNGSFIVQNDGPLEGVYVVRVAVDDPSAITWISVTPSGFAMAPGELRMVNFSISIGEGQAKAGTYRIMFMPTRLPLAVEPYMDNFANYVSYFDRYNLTIEIPGGSAGSAGTEMTPVIFSENPDRVNLVQFAAPENGTSALVQIDRAVRINVPNGAPVNQPVNISLSIYQGLSSRGISLMAISPDGDFYPIEGDTFTFDKIGRWSVAALVGDIVLVGKPVDVSAGGVQLVMPGLTTILAAISLLLLLSVIPIWFATRARRRHDPYEDVIFKAYVVRKYIDQFDIYRLKNAVAILTQEFDDLVKRNVRGRKDDARASIEELKTLSQFGPG